MLYSYNKILAKAVLANPATPRKGLFSKVPCVAALLQIFSTPIKK